MKGIKSKLNCSFLSTSWFSGETVQLSPVVSTKARVLVSRADFQGTKTLVLTSKMIFTGLNCCTTSSIAGRRVSFTLGGGRNWCPRVFRKLQISKGQPPPDWMLLESPHKLLSVQNLCSPTRGAPSQVPIDKLPAVPLSAVGSHRCG